MTNEANQNARLFEQMIDAAPAGFCVVGLDGRFQRVNPYMCQLLGYTADELTQLKFADLTHKDDVNQDSNAFNKMLEGHFSHYQTEKRYLRKDGSAVWIKLTSNIIRDDQNEPIHFVTVLQDITSRKQAEEALSTSERRFRTLFQQAPFSAQLLALDGRTLQVNAAWERTFQLPKDFLESYILKEYNILKDPQLEAKGIIPYLRAAFAGESVIVEPILYDPAEANQPGRARWLGAYIHPIKNEEGEVMEVVLIHHDLTDRIEIEAELKASKNAAESANRLKSSFLANMSHEIRTPLGAILGFTNLLKDDNLPATDRHRYLEIIERSGHSLTQVINDILDLSRVEAGSLFIDKTDVRIREVVTDVIDLLQVEAKKKSLLLSSEIDTQVPEFVITDAIRLKQMLINLVGNALKFTSQGEVLIKVKSNSESVSIAVVDTGIGIMDEDRKWLFQPFRQLDASNTRQFGGTGLGLALSRKLAHALGGNIELAESKPNVGSTFVITLPYDFTPIESQPMFPDIFTGEEFKDPDEEILARLRILVVDDSPDNRLLVERILSLKKATVDFAANGEEAVQKVSQNPYDVILMDIQMPVKDGLKATTEIRKLGFRTPIIALTAHAMNEDLEKSFEAGCNDHLSKPVTAQTLIRAIITQAQSRHLTR